MSQPFGSAFAETMAISWYRDQSWSGMALQKMQPMALHPGAHALHYGSECFEGLKAYRGKNGGVHLFRVDRHVARLRRSADLLCLPVPEASFIESMIEAVVDASRNSIPAFPGSLYMRPVLIGTQGNIGSATKPTEEACLYVIASPVGNYFEQGERPLRLLVGDGQMRSTPEFGCAKTGGNYAAALRFTTDAKKRWQADQVLFCPAGDVQETGAANFLMIDDRRVLTKNLDGSILEGVTRDSLLRLARDLGYEIEERSFQIPELLERAAVSEAALSGTAAVLTSVGTLIHQGREHPVGDGKAGANVRKLRALLNSIQSGEAEDRYGWRRPV
jgi:branched-chain amino acid aminotransferase